MPRINSSCAYFPCHSGLEDCTFCYCPFYPCLNSKLGEYVFFKKNHQRIWSCKDCSWVHQKNIVDKILKSIRFGSISPYLNNLKAKNTGIIILGHGSRVKKTNATIARVVKDIKAKTGIKIIQPSYLQLTGPDLAASVKKAVEKDAKKIVIVPFFLFTGNHVGRDIPREIKKLAGLYPGVKFIYSKNIGDDPAVSDIVLGCINQALEGER